jgi:hypothetical protein
LKHVGCFELDGATPEKANGNLFFTILDPQMGNEFEQQLHVITNTFLPVSRRDNFGHQRVQTLGNFLV